MAIILCSSNSIRKCLIWKLATSFCRRQIYGYYAIKLKFLWILSVVYSNQISDELLRIITVWQLIDIENIVANVSQQIRVKFEKGISLE